jgi:hypothetical protein
MKERPILFSGPMVRAILPGTKTQTRRVIKPQPDKDGLSKVIDGLWQDTDGRPYRCPYGVPGDRLWVRETWAVQHEYDAAAPSEIGASARWHYAATEDLGGLRKRPSIFLPRRGSRILLEITDIRVERLQKISEADAKAEGAPLEQPVMGPPCHVLGFLNIWETINGAGSWDADPSVWVVLFRRLLSIVG